MTREADGRMEQTILDAAEHLFLKKGFALTSTTEIAEAAGCAPGSRWRTTGCSI